MRPSRQDLRDLLERRRRTPWPARSPGDGVAVVVVNYNTRELISHLVFSLHRVLPPGALAEVVVVDNASTDGSRERLQAAADAGLVHLIANRRQRGHGPGLNQGLSWLARHRADRVRYVWVLDSDVVVLRGDVLDDAVPAMDGAALLGQPEARDLVPLNCLLLDPARAWVRGVAPFYDHGDPSERLQASLGAPVSGFPFRHHSYVLHLGRGTLAAIAEGGETDHPLYAWAAGHREQHYGGHPFGPELHRAVVDAYEAAMADGDFVAACRAPERVVIDLARPLPPVEELRRIVEEDRLDELRRRLTS